MEVSEVLSFETLPRELQVTNEAVYNDAVRVTKIFSGIFFFGLAAWLSMANGTKLSFIQQAALEKRLTVCCFLGVYVGAFSAFFNFFQLTEVDDILLDRASSFTLDFSRPLEWIMTCPLMQLALVLMGGSRIPEYRRMLMPGLSVAVLVCGTASMLLFDVWVYVAYGVGILFASVMFFLNRLQIIEHSDGQECLMYGDSEFRKASILLIVTWIPFPTFYALSPEGFGIINDVLFVQVGWAFLNIVSKFTFIFYIQRIKDNYCNRLKVKREFAGVQSAAPKGPTVNADGTITPPLSGMALAQSKQAEKAQSEMGALVVETMNFLGMAQNSERFLWLLQHSNVTSLRHLECLSQDECLKLQLPWDLVAAVQKRLRVWKLEMQDEAELALEQGELHYQMEEPVNPLKNSTLVDKLHAVQAAGQESHPQVQYAPPLPGMVADDSHIQRIEVAFHHHADDPFEPPLIDVGDFLEARRLSREERARAYLQEARRNLPQQPAHICGGRCARACGHPENDDLRQFTCDVGHFYDVERLFWRIPRREGWWNDWHIEIEEPEELQTVNENEII